MSRKKQDGGDSLAGNTDGQVVIKIDLSSNDAEKELSRLKKKFLSLEEDLTVGQHKKDALTKKLEEIDRQIDGINRKKVEFGGSGLSDSEAYTLESLTKSASEIDMAIQKQNKSLEDTQMTLDGVKLRYEEVKATAEQAAQAEAEKAAADQAAAEEAAQAAAEKAAAEQAAEATNAAAEETSQAEITTPEQGPDAAGEVEEVNQSITRTQAALGHIKEQIRSSFDFSHAKEDLRSLLSMFGSMVGKIAAGAAKITFNAAKKGVSALVSGLKSCVAYIGKIFSGGKSLSKSFGGIGASIKRIAPALLATEGVLGILRKAVSAYMEQNQQLANTLNGAWAGLGNIMGPVIDRMVNLLANAIAYFTKFLNLLGFTGKAASKQINGAGGSAKKETDKLKKQLMSFDELNILQDNETDSDGGGSGADTGATPNVQLPDWAQLMAQQLRSAQWAEAATTLTTALNNMVDSVDWAGIGAKIGFWLNGAMTFLATVINTFDWQGLGGSLATAVNNLVSSVDWSNLGTILAGKFKIVVSTLAGFILNLDMVELAHAASNIVISFFNSITDTIVNTDWYAIGEQIKTFLVNIDWIGIAEAVAEFAGAAVGAFFSLLGGLLAEAWGNLTDWWNDVAYEDGQFTIEGLLNGIGDALVNIGTWIYNHIFKPFVDGFCDAFGIHSPSTVMAEQGGYIIDGLLNGITGAWQRVKDWFSKALSDIKNAFSNAWTSVRNTTVNIWNGIVNAIRGAVNRVISVINRMISAVVNGINAVFRRLSFNISLPGGRSIGLSLPQFSAPQIPYLAQGAVIPPNAPFAAVLGDQKHGTNIEAPLETIQQAVAQVMDDQLAAMMAGFEAVVQAIQEKNMSVVIGDRDIGEANARYSRQMAIRRG